MHTLRTLVVLFALFLASLFGTTTEASPRPAGGPSLRGIPAIQIHELPAEARQTLALIRRGGPFPFRRDGVVFQNREHRLPAQAAGYYHEFTVPTPGQRDRGPRRIISGSPDEYYYTADHYRSFSRIQP
jgi:ribonuclease T1